MINVEVARRPSRRDVAGPARSKNESFSKANSPPHDAATTLPKQTKSSEAEHFYAPPQIISRNRIAFVAPSLSIAVRFGTTLHQICSHCTPITYMKTSAHSSNISRNRGTTRRNEVQEQEDPFDIDSTTSSGCCANFLSQLHGDLCFAFQFLCWACTATSNTGNSSE